MVDLPRINIAQMKRKGSVKIKSSGSISAPVATLIFSFPTGEKAKPEGNSLSSELQKQMRSADGCRTLSVHLMAKRKDFRS